MRFSRPFVCLAAALAALVSGCGGEAPDADSTGPVVRDSAGIRIVESSGPAWGEGEGWTVAEDPDLVLSELAGVPLYLASSLDVDAAGRILVAHASEQQLVVLERDGSLVRTIGRRGEGPGEFTALGRAFWIHGDSVLAIDGGGRVTVFSLADEGVRTATLPRDLSEVSSPGMRGALEDGRLILDGWMRGPAEDGRVAFGEILSTSPTLESPRHLVTMPFSYCVEGLGARCAIETFGPVVTLDVGNDAVVSGLGSTYQVRRDEPPPEARSEIWRLRRAPVAVTDEMWAEYRDALGDGAAEVLDDVVRDQGMPEHLPHFKEIVAAEDGGVWVQEEERVGSMFFTPAERVRDGRLWGVFDPSGQFLGRVRTPPDFALRVVADDYVLGVHRDDFDVETIRRYPLDRGGG